MSKTILITGSTDGIGKLAALNLANAGYHVYLHGRDADELASVIIEVKAVAIGAATDNIHQDNANPNHFVTYEVWESQELMEQHGQSTHFQNFMKPTKDMIENSNMTLMTRMT